MSQAEDAMKLAARTGMTLKEAWARVKGDKAAVEGSSDEDDEALIESILGSKEQGW